MTLFGPTHGIQTQHITFDAWWWGQLLTLPCEKDHWLGKSVNWTHLKWCSFFFFTSQCFYGVCNGVLLTSLFTWLCKSLYISNGLRVSQHQIYSSKVHCRQWTLKNAELKEIIKTNVQFHFSRVFLLMLLYSFLSRSFDV